MTLTQHNELPDNYTSSHGGWVFDLDEDGDVEEVREAILAWTEWLAFLEQRQRSKTEKPLF